MSPPTPAQQTGEMRSLMLRAWLEPGSPPQIRARVVEIALGRRERSVLVTTSIDEVCRAVRSWLEALQAPDPGDNGNGAEAPGS